MRCICQSALPPENRATEPPAAGHGLHPTVKPQTLSGVGSVPVGCETPDLSNGYVPLPEGGKIAVSFFFGRGSIVLARVLCLHSASTLGSLLDATPFRRRKFPQRTVDKKPACFEQPPHGYHQGVAGAVVVI